MKRIIIPLAILAVLVGAGSLIFFNPPAMNHHGAPSGPQTVVEVASVTTRDYQITVNSYGTVQPRTQSILVAQVSGQIVTVKPEFRPGGFFTTGDHLMTIDPRDYEANVKIAEATLMDALQLQAQEAARAEQAQTDWVRLGDPLETPSELLLRKPQLEAAKARVSSARSSLTKSNLSLERTTIQAPFSGRVLRQLVDIGQVVTVGAQLAEVYATDYVEIRLPIRNADLAFVELPETQTVDAPTAKINSNLGSETTWHAEIIRTEGAIDEVARQLHIVAQITDPFGTEQSVERPLKIGEYVTAEIAGKTLQDVVVIPINTIYQNSYVYVVSDGLLQRRNIDIAWQNNIEAIVAAGLSSADALVTTPLGQITSGTPVRIAGETIANTKKRSAAPRPPSAAGVAN
jgi:RND family efflux transporter MFP subunit